MEYFNEKLRLVQQQTQSLLCIGLDTDPQKLPQHFQRNARAVLDFNRAIIDATADLVCAYKPNLAFYEALGEEGWMVLKKTVEYIPSSVLSIGDGKRGDIGNTSERYASALFNDCRFDAVTVNPYMGTDSVEQFLQNPEKGVFLLALTSNAGSKDFQRLKVGRMPLYLKVVKKAVEWNKNNNIGIVVGATQATELKKVRAIAKELPILIPGIGAQGGDLKRSVLYGCSKKKDLAIINVSRSVLYASSGRDFQEAARQAAQSVRDQIRTILE